MPNTASPEGGASRSPSRGTKNRAFAAATWNMGAVVHDRGERERPGAPSMLSAKARRVIVGVAGLFGSALFIGLAIRRLDFNSVLATWEHARPMPWLPLAVLAYT